MKTDLYTRNCPKCGKIITYKNKKTHYLMVKRNSICRACADKNAGIKNSINRKGIPIGPFTEEHKKKLVIAHKNSKKWHDSMNSPEYREKHRQKMFKLIKKNKTNVGFNHSACDVFDFINSKLNWNGIHAKNGKEKVIDRFFLDYYVPELNLVIEWDEKHHKKPKQKIIDAIKQNTVMKNLGCEFYRIDDVTKQVRKIDAISTNRLELLQTLINEYYER